MMTNLILLDTASLIALLFVVLIGLPHGAFDGAIANHLGAGRSLAAGMKFIAIYCAVALLVIAIWLIAPGLTLTLFLIISMIHFGRGDAAAESQPALLIQILLHGGLPIFGIIYLQQDSVTPLFNALTDGSSDLALSLAEIIAPLMTAMTALYVLLAFRDPSLRPRLAELYCSQSLLPPCLHLSVLPSIFALSILAGICAGFGICYRLPRHQEGFSPKQQALQSPVGSLAPRCFSGLIAVIRRLNY